MPTVVRCSLAGIIPNLRLAIDYSLQEKMEFVDLNIYYSFTNKNPDKDNCVKRFSSKPKSIVLKQHENEQIFN